MKKILLISVVLILLAMVTYDIYTDNVRKNNKKNELQASATISGASGSTSVTAIAPATAIANNDPQNITGGAPASVVSHHHTGKHINNGMATVTGDESDHLLAMNTNDADGLVVIMDGNDETPATTVETPEVYYGKMPKVEKENKIRTVRNFRFGPEIGIMQNSYYNNDMSKRPQTGYHIGVVADIGLGDHFALQPGLRYAMKGVQLESTTYGATMEVDTRDKIDLHYIEVPLDLVAKFGNKDDARIIVGIGPYISYLVKAQDKYETTTYTYGSAAARTTQDIPAGDVVVRSNVTEGQYSLPIGNGGGHATPGPGAQTGSVQTLDWGLNGFIGCETPGGLFMKAGSEVGLMAVQQNASGTYTNKNYNFFVSLGYLIGSRK